VELTWLMRLRIAAAATVGAILIGILAWPLAAPEPMGAVSLLAHAINFSDALILAGLAVLAGFVSYFICWPYGREIGILAAPSGLAVWAVRSGSIAGLLQLNPTVAQRRALFATLKWEPLFWLAIVAAGFAGVLIGQKIRSKPKTDEKGEKPKSKSALYLNTIIAVVGAVLIAQFCIGVFVQDTELGPMMGQPAIGQIVFGVTVSFGLAAFIVKYFLDASYIWPAIASAFVTAFGIITYIKQDMLQHLVASWPAVFFSHTVNAVLPVQMVAFGTLGSIAGYWLAIRYNFRRKHP